MRERTAQIRGYSDPGEVAAFVGRAGPQITPTRRQRALATLTWERRQGDVPDLVSERSPRLREVALGDVAKSGSRAPAGRFRARRDESARMSFVRPWRGHGPLVESSRLYEQNLSAMTAKSAIVNGQEVVIRSTPNFADIAVFADDFQRWIRPRG